MMDSTELVMKSSCVVSATGLKNDSASAIEVPDGD